MSFSLHEGRANQHQPGVPPPPSACQTKHEDDNEGCIAAAVVVTLEKKPVDYWRQQVLSRK